MTHPQIDQIIYEKGEPVGYRCGKEWYHLDWTLNTHHAMPSGRERLGHGECGVVWRDGNEAVKSIYGIGRKTIEGEVYGLLRFIEGIADGYQDGDEIRTPVFGNVISRYTIREPQRLLFGPLLAANMKRIENALHALSRAGYNYGDVLQLGIDDDAQTHLLDFSATKKSENAASDNAKRLHELKADFHA